MRRPVVATVVIALALVAPPATAHGAGDADGGGSTPRPTFVRGACAAPVPVDPRVTCGSVTLPEDRAHPRHAAVHLAVAIVHTRSIHPRPDPIVYLAGGPGGSASVSVSSFLAFDTGGDRDVVLFDQRGTGQSTPSLNCPEVEQSIWTVLGTAEPVPVEQVPLDAAFRACRDRLVTAGIDLNAYNTATNADDVADLRVALGYRAWNLFGVSYGTTLALETMRRHPRGIRSVVIDSVYPTTVSDGGAALAASATRVFNQFFDGCAASPTCAAKYPRLRRDFDEVVAALDARPYHSTVPDPTTGTPHAIVLTGADVVGGFFDAFYDSSLIGTLPGLIETLHRGQLGILDLLAAQDVPFLTSLSEGMEESVNCADRQRLYDSRAAARALHDHPDYGTLFLLSYADECSTWSVRSLAPSFNHPVRSGIRTLVFGDQYDPITPPAYSSGTAAALRRATFVEFPGLGHGAVFSGRPCPSAIFHAFVDDPGRVPDRSCIASMGPPNWQ